jgi:glycosyltransferase-like protein
MRDGARLDIALLTHSVNPRGGVVHTLELADALHERGHRVTVFAPAASGQAMFRHTRCAVDLVSIDAGRLGVVEMVATRRAAFVAHLSRTLQAARFDVMHAQDAIGGNALADLVERGEIDGFLRTVHHLDTFDDPRLMAWQHRAFAQASHVLCVSQTWRDRLRLEHGVCATRVDNGVDLARYGRTPRAGDAGVARRHGLRPGAPLLLAVGGIEERKNAVRTLQAFAQLRRTHPGAQLAIAGGASLLDHDHYSRQFQSVLAASALAVGADADVVLTGPVPDVDMPALFRLADVVAMPSLREGFGLVVLEALASGTPVVVSDLAPFTEYLARDEDVDHACWADPTCVDSIAQAMRRALDPRHRHALAQATPAVCERFSWHRSAADHEALYRAHRSPARSRHRPAVVRTPSELSAQD